MLEWQAARKYFEFEAICMLERLLWLSGWEQLGGVVKKATAKAFPLSVVARPGQGSTGELQGGFHFGDG